MTANRDFQAAYRKLEEQMRRLAELEGSIFLPNPEPKESAKYVLICMEPSLGRWARSEKEAQKKIKAGFRNFISSIEDFILHFCLRNYLCYSSEKYHITDLSKGAMKTKQANLERFKRYDRWYPLLMKEIDLIAAPKAHFFAVGKDVFRYLQKKKFPYPFTYILHYSAQAARARNAGISGREKSFWVFAENINMNDILYVAKEVLKETSVSKEISDSIILNLSKKNLTVSRKKLIFNYKIEFEKILNGSQ